MSLRRRIRSQNFLCESISQTHQAIDAKSFLVRHIRAYFSIHQVLSGLIKTGKVNLDLNDDLGRTQLSWVAGEGYEEVVELLLKGSTDVDYRDIEYSQTPLQSTAEKGREALVKLLVENGANVNSRGK